MADDEAGRRAATQVVALAGEIRDVTASGAQEGDAFREPSFSPRQAPSSPPLQSTSRTVAASLGARISSRPTSRLLAHRGVCGSRSTGRPPLLLPRLDQSSGASSTGRSKGTRPSWWLRIPSLGRITTRRRLRRTRRPWQRHTTPRRNTSPQGLAPVLSAQPPPRDLPSWRWRSARARGKIGSGAYCVLRRCLMNCFSRVNLLVFRCGDSIKETQPTKQELNLAIFTFAHNQTHACWLPGSRPGLPRLHLLARLYETNKPNKP